jgi:hypothetical protein
MDLDDLSDKLADALHEIVPEDYDVYEYQAMVMIEGAGYRAASDVEDFVDEEGVPYEERASRAAWDALSMVQDYVAEALTEPWPGEGTFLPLPKVEVTPNEIRMWFEDEAGRRVLEAPVVKW